MSRLIMILGVSACLAVCASAETPLFQDDFTAPPAQWTLQPPINALGPIPTNAVWTTEPGTLVAEGTAAPWSLMTAGEAAWTDYRLSAKVTIRKPGPKADFPIFHGEYDRWLPRAWYPPLAAHPGQFRYRYYAGEFDWGSDAAIWVRYQDRQNCYRVQLSTEYQEMILWHGVGGYLAVVPCKLKPGRTYKMEVLAQGPHIQVLLDGKRKIDYRHACLPTLTGRIGVGTYQAAVAFSAVNVTALSPAAAAPAHRARFNTRMWRSQRWVFDNNEPICLWEKSSATPPGYCAGMLSYYHIKLRPGYRPTYCAWVGVGASYAGGQGCALAGTPQDIKTRGENSDRLTIRFQTALPDKGMDVANTDTLTYDATRGTYRHDMLGECTLRKDTTWTLMELCDPLTYNNKEPGLSNRYRWLPAGHQWGVFPDEDGTIRRHPISQSLNIGGQNNWISCTSNSYWVLLPDRAVCPAWEHLTPGERMTYGVCHWGYDWHQSLYWQDKPRTFKAGDTYTVHYVMTGYPPAEGENLLRSSALHPRMENPPPPGSRSGFLQVPSLLAYPVVEPAGTTFDKLYSVRAPYVGWQWYGDYNNDRDTGRTDRSSMRVDGPARVNGQFYHHMIDGNARRYLCTFWLKTRGVRGPAPVAILQYPWDEKAEKDILDTGLTGDNDWTEFSVVTTQPVIKTNTSDSTEFVLECRGTGSVWLDDWSVRPLADGEQPVEKRGAHATLAPGPVSTDLLLDLPCGEGSGASLYDASGHGNHVKLHGVTWVHAGQRPALRFEGSNACAFVPMRSPELQPADKGVYKADGLTLEAWVRPAAGMKSGGVIGIGNSPWLSLRSAGDRFQAVFACGRLGGPGLEVISTPDVATGRWTHLAATISPTNVVRLYVNGKPAGEKPLGGKLTLATWASFVSIGTYATAHGSPYTGDLTGIRWWGRAATEAEIAAAASAPPEKP